MNESEDSPGREGTGVREGGGEGGEGESEGKRERERERKRERELAGEREREREREREGGRLKRKQCGVCSAAIRRSEATAWIWVRSAREV